MSAAAEAAPVNPSGKKKLLLIGAIVAILALGGGAAAFFMTKPKPADSTKDSGKDGAKDGAKSEGAREAKRDPKAKPTFVPFESFTVNLNDKENERYAQIVFSIETLDSATGDVVKAQMPAIRGRVLMTLSSKTAGQLLGREGKEQLAKDILADARKIMDLSEADKSLIEVHFSQFVMQ
ncbi:MAG: flagellar basal body-associated FliL family protein [Aeromicrobium sp.]|nr:flagellar basal body-associated FliL family protein [Burkholderiales bacterium]